MFAANFLIIYLGGKGIKYTLEFKEIESYILDIS
jgi:hypothetical protein